MSMLSNWDDILFLNDQLSEDERMIKQAASSFCQQKLLPSIIQATRNVHFDPRIISQFGELGLLGATMISLAKRNNCGKSLDIARMSRDMHRLILGHVQTGLQAFL